MLITSRSRDRRRGVILIVVLSMLTLFAIVGITFVMVANAQATSSQVAADSERQFRPEVDPEGAFALFLGQLLYGVNDTDDEIGIYSALRGHDLARSIYG